MRLNLSIPISLTGLAVAAVAIGAYHVFVEALFPATGMDLFWILYVASGFNLYGYYFRFASLVRPSVYRQRYRELREVAAWTRKKIQANRHIPVKHGRKAVKEYPLIVAMWIAFVLGVVATPMVGGWAYAPMSIIWVLVFYQSWQEGSKRQERPASTEAN